MLCMVDPAILAGRLMYSKLLRFEGPTREPLRYVEHAENLALHADRRTNQRYACEERRVVASSLRCSLMLAVDQLGGCPRDDRNRTMNATRGTRKRVEHDRPPICAPLARNRRRLRKPARPVVMQVGPF